MPIDNLLPGCHSKILIHLHPAITPSDKGSVTDNNIQQFLVFTLLKLTTVQSTLNRTFPVKKELDS